VHGDRYIDVAWYRPAPRWIIQQGYKGVIGYLCPKQVDPTKEMSADYAKGLIGAGLEVAYVFETTATRATEGMQAGMDDARYADSRTDYQGVVFFSVDSDVPWSQIQPYFNGVKSGSKRPVSLRGIYGSGDNCRAARYGGYAHRTWLSLSTGWSGSKNLTDIDLHQVADMGQWDENVALVDDWGQSGQGGFLMALSDQQQKQLLDNSTHVFNWVHGLDVMAQGRGANNLADLLAKMGDEIDQIKARQTGTG
jgi:hypothetical protein